MNRQVERPDAIITYIPSLVRPGAMAVVTRLPGDAQPLQWQDVSFLQRVDMLPGQSFVFASIAGPVTQTYGVFLEIASAPVMPVAGHLAPSPPPPRATSPTPPMTRRASSVPVAMPSTPPAVLDQDMANA